MVGSVTTPRIPSSTNLGVTRGIRVKSANERMSEDEADMVEIREKPRVK